MASQRPRSTRDEIARQLLLIESVVEGHRGDITLPELQAAYRVTTGKFIEERTLLRRLAELERQGRVRKEGRTRARRYRPIGDQARAQATTPTREAQVATSARPPGTPAPASDARGDDDDAIPLSAVGAEIRALVRQPVAKRTPVGYDEEFLRCYQPGESWYLTEAIRHRLHELGRTPEPDRPAGTFARDIYERLLIDLAWASSRLEGNTYSRLDTQNLLEHGVQAEGKTAIDAQMILNHKKAIEFLVEGAEEVGFAAHTFRNLHAALAENIIGDSRDEGRVRTRIVQITGTTFLPLSIPQKLEELFILLLAKADAIPDPFEQAFFVMVHLPYLQPFADVNKRTSRLGANIPLIKANLCPLSFIGVPERAYIDGTLAIYEYRRIELLRDVFVWAYERSCAQYRVVRASIEEPDPIRLRYRALLNQAIREIVQQGRSPQVGDMREWAAAHEVPAADQEVFAETALGLALDLHDGAIARYGLRPSEFRDWKVRIAASTE